MQHKQTNTDQRDRGFASLYSHVTSESIVEEEFTQTGHNQNKNTGKEREGGTVGYKQQPHEAQDSRTIIFCVCMFVSS